MNSSKPRTSNNGCRRRDDASPKGAPTRVVPREDVPSLVLLLDGKRRRVAAADLDDEALAAACARAKKVVIGLDALLDFDVFERVRMLYFAARVTNARYRVGGTDDDDLVDAVLALEPGDGTGRVACWRSAALEATAFAHPHAVDIACSKIRDALADHGIKGVRVSSLVAEVRRILDRITPQDRAVPDGQRVLDVLPDAPVVDAAAVPPGWVLGPQGIMWREARSGEAVLGPVLIVERGKDVRGGTETATLAYLQDGHWHERVVDRRQIADSRAIVGLAEFGVPVTSNSAKTLVQFLAEYFAVNAIHIPRVRHTTRQGWHDGERVFVLGDTVVCADEEAPEAGTLRFRPADSGSGTLAAGFARAGELVAWCAAARIARAHPRLWFVLSAAYVPPLLQILRVPSFVLNLSGDTSTGKTTALQLVASVWGDPRQLIRSWDSTATWRERAAAMLQSLPLVLDDTMRVSEANRPEIGRTIYMLAEGRSRGRGTVDGLADQDTWRTVLFSSGEDPIRSFVRRADGTRGRCIDLWGRPFGGQSAEHAAEVRRLQEIVEQHHGHAGYALVYALATGMFDPQALRDEHARDVAELEARAAGNAVVGRLAAPLAAIRVASRIAHKLLALRGAWTDPVEPVWDDLTRDVAETDRRREALRVVHAWCVAHRDEFWPPTTNVPRDPETRTPRQPPSGWAGRWGVDQRRGVLPFDAELPEEPAWIGIDRGRLRRILDEAGLDFEATLRGWHELGWLVCDGDAVGHPRRDKSTTIGDERVRVVAIRRSAIDEVCL